MSSISNMEKATADDLRDQLGSKVNHKSSLEELEQAAILKDPAKVAAAIQPFQKSIAQSLARAQLQQALKNRPSSGELLAKGILQDPQGFEDDEVYNYLTRLKKEQWKCAVPEAQSRSSKFILLRILLKSVAILTETGDLTLEQKRKLKDLIVTQSPVLLRAARNFDLRRDLGVFRDSLRTLATLPSN